MKGLNSGCVTVMNYLTAVCEILRAHLFWHMDDILILFFFYLDDILILFCCLNISKTFFLHSPLFS